MTAIDFAKAAGWALVILALNMLLATVTILTANLLRDNPLPPETIAVWTAPVGGFLLSFLTLQWLTARRPDRPWLPFALTVAAAYLLIDVGVGMAASGAAVFSPVFALSLTLLVAGSVLGAWTSRPRA